MVRVQCSTCKHWRPLIGYAIGGCSNIPNYKALNEDKTVNRSDCTRPTDVCPDHIKKETFYG